MQSYKLCARIFCFTRLLIHLNGLVEVFYFTGQRSWTHGSGAMPCMYFCNLKKCFQGVVHEVMTSTSVYMNIDKPRRYKFSFCVNFNLAFNVKSIFTYLFYPARIDQ